MCVDNIENITKIINQVTGLNLSPRTEWLHSGYRFHDDAHPDIYITVNELEDDSLIVTISNFEKDMQLASALKLAYPNAKVWTIEHV